MANFLWEEKIFLDSLASLMGLDAQRSSVIVEVISLLFSDIWLFFSVRVTLKTSLTDLVDLNGIENRITDAGVGNYQERWLLYRLLVGQFQPSCLSDEIISWRVDPHQFWLPPATHLFAPAFWICQAGLLINISSF